MNNFEQTLSIIKPDSVKNGHIGNIIALYESKGFIIKALKIIKKANKRLTAGPEIAIFKLPFEVGHSFSRLAIPPRKKSVMSLTFRPSPIATKE